MPHIIIEHSKNLANKLDIPALTLAIHNKLSEQKSFDIQAIKSRSISYENYNVTTFGGTKDFLHLQLRIMIGRSHEDIHQAVENLSKTILSLIPTSTELTIEVCEMNKNFYFKKSAQ
ncbi:MAG: 5-carboxymethyl-2-hydroxymuconate Delta-isomerase [Pseudobdellovibrionaceae bacterium]